MILRSSPHSLPLPNCHLPPANSCSRGIPSCGMRRCLRGVAGASCTRPAADPGHRFTWIYSHECAPLRREKCLPSGVLRMSCNVFCERKHFFLALRVRSPSWCACVSVWDRRTPVCRCVFSVGLAADGLCEMTIQKTARVLTTLPGYYYNLYYYSSPHSGSTLQLYTHSSHIHPLV